MKSVKMTSRKWGRLLACLLAATFVFAVLPLPAAQALGPLSPDPFVPCPGVQCPSGHGPGFPCPGSPLRIEISRYPNQCVYVPGEEFNALGMLVLAHYADGTSAAVTNYTWSPAGPLRLGISRIEVAYTWGGIIYRTWLPIQVTRQRPLLPTQNPLSLIGGSPFARPSAGTQLVSALPFNDVDPTDSDYEAIKYLYEQNIMKGVSERSFDKGSRLTRGMLAAILYNADGAPSVSYSGAFTDVPAGEWYTKGVEWAASRGILKGYDNGAFGPNDAVTREQLAAILHRCAVRKGYAMGIANPHIADAAKVSDYAVEAVNWAVLNGILLADGGFVRPGDAALRGEVATAIYTYLQDMAR